MKHSWIMPLFISLIFPAFLAADTNTVTNTGTNSAAANATIPPEESFRIVKTKIVASLPEAFTAELQGKPIGKKLESIPKDSYLDKNKRIYVEMNYSKKNGITFLVKNTDELYRDLYKDLPRQFFAFDILLSKIDNDLFFKKYEVTAETSEDSYTLLKLRVKAAENNLLLYVENASGKIYRIDYRLGKEILNSTLVSYQEIEKNGKKYILPMTFLSKMFSKSKEFLARSS